VRLGNRRCCFHNSRSRWFQTFSDARRLVRAVRSRQIPEAYRHGVEQAVPCAPPLSRLVTPRCRGPPSIPFSCVPCVVPPSRPRPVPSLPGERGAKTRDHPTRTCMFEKTCN
jgi:hypothetical protein